MTLIYFTIYWIIISWLAWYVNKPDKEVKEFYAKMSAVGIAGAVNGKIAGEALFLSTHCAIDPDRERKISLNKSINKIENYIRCIEVLKESAIMANKTIEELKQAMDKVYDEKSRT